MRKIILVIIVTLIATTNTMAQWTTSAGTISTTNNVGIGTSAPSANLQVIGNANIGRNTSVALPVRLDITSGAGNQDARIDFGYYTTFDATGYMMGRWGVDGSFRISDYPTGAELTRFMISTSGNIGIGTTTPTYKLDVVGNARFTTDILVNSVSIGNGGGARSQNTVMGLSAGPINTTGINNSFFGNFSGQFNTTGSENSFFGYGSGSLNTGSFNSYFGSKAGQGSTTGSRNTYIGLTAGYVNTTGSDNAFVGSQSGVYSNTGSRNTFIGANSGFTFTSGNNNTLIGYMPVLFTPMYTGSGNTFIGGNISGLDAAISNSVLIADGNGSVRFFSSSNGNVGIGTTKTADLTYKLYVETGIRTRKVKVDALTWADFVFEKNYGLLPLPQLEQYIMANKHLPLVPSAAEVAAQGIDLGANQVLLLQKIEELTLYTIEQNKQHVALQQKVVNQQQQIDALLKAVEKQQVPAKQ